MENVDSLYVILWEFHIKSGSESRFEQVYGPEGDWARFFKQGEGYVATELIRDVKNPRRYVTMDYWVSRTAHESFRERWMDEYKRLDAQCESLTEREMPLGSFVAVGRSQPLPFKAG